MSPVDRWFLRFILLMLAFIAGAQAVEARHNRHRTIEVICDETGGHDEGGGR